MAVQYLVPCSCGLKSSVAPSQAGQRVRCKCGATIDVPPMRRLTSLEQVGDEPPGPPRLWTLRWALVFLGLFIALPSVAVSSYLYVNRPEFDTKPVQLEVDDLTLTESWQLWKRYEMFGLVERDTVLSQAYRTQLATIDRWVTLGVILAVVGLCIAASGAFVGPKQRRAEPALAKPGRKRRRR